MIFKSRNVRRTQADRGVSSEPQTCQMGVVAGHLKAGGNQALGATSCDARLVRATFADGTERPAAKRSKAERAQARLRLLRHPGSDFLAGTFAHACGCARPALQTLDMVLLRCWFGWNARVHAESQQHRGLHHRDGHGSAHAVRCARP